MGRKKTDISGKKFKNLLAIRPSYVKNKKYLYWECRCDCGETCFATSTDLNRGRINYCKKCSEKKSHRSNLELLYGNYKRNSSKRNLFFDLSIDEFDILIKSNCFYCGIEPSQIFYKKGMKFSLKYNGVDRIDNNLGYKIENCVTACKFCNLAKRGFELNEFMEWINKIKKTIN